jgi:DNA modification methylase
MAELITDIRCGDCLEILRRFDDDHFDLIITSPPYADSRDRTYGGIRPDDYVASWVRAQLAKLRASSDAIRLE